MQEELTDVKNFGTLSPMIGFADWVKSLDNEKLGEIVKKENFPKVEFLKSLGVTTKIVDFEKQELSK